MRLVYFLICAVAGLVIAYKAQPFAHDNSDVLSTIVTVMTVLAGFMIAIITVLGDPALIPGDSWRSVASRKDSVEARIIRHSYLFLLYLLTIAFIFTGAIIKKIPDAKLWPWIPIWIDYAYLFFGSTSFLLSFGLPFSLKKIQLQRLDIEEARRKSAQSDKKISDGDGHRGTLNGHPTVASDGG